MRKFLRLAGCCLAAVVLDGPSVAMRAEAAEKPLPIFILAGQSNMQGHAQVSTLKHLGMDSRTAPMLDEILAEDDSPQTCDQVWISSIGHDGGETERFGRLSPDFGAAGRGPKIGPEYTFGIYMQKMLDQPILIIKTAWGGKSLNTDFRPPSAGPYEFNERQLEGFRKQDKDLQEIVDAKREATGHYYRLMLDHVRKVLGDIQRVYPKYDPEAGYELAGFVWFQGWNDMVDGGTYPDRYQPGGYQQYSDAMAHFIRDIRNDLSAPALPFVIGVLGVGGPTDDYGADQIRYKPVHDQFRQAMEAPAKLPEFQGNVVAVRTEKYWDAELAELSSRWGQINAQRRSLARDASLSAPAREKELERFIAELYTAEERKILEVGRSNAEFHYLGSGKIMAQIGRAFAEAVRQASVK